MLIMIMTPADARHGFMATASERAAKNDAPAPFTGARLRRARSPARQPGVVLQQTEQGTPL